MTLLDLNCISCVCGNYNFPDLCIGDECRNILYLAFLFDKSMGYKWGYDEEDYAEANNIDLCHFDGGTVTFMLDADWDSHIEVTVDRDYCIDKIEFYDGTFDNSFINSFSFREIHS